MTKRPEEIALMAESGRLLAQVFGHLDRLNLVGMSTMQVNDLVDDLIVRELDARPASKGQRIRLRAQCLTQPRGLPRHPILCGHPAGRGHRELRHHAGEKRLHRRFQQDLSGGRSVTTGSAACADGLRGDVERHPGRPPGATLGDVGHAIERHARKNGYSIVKEYCGHGIGREMHEEPQVLHWGKPRTGLVLREGMVFTIEPMVNKGRSAIRTEDDGWTVVTRDGQLSAQFEHTVAVTQSGVSVLTLRPGEKPH